MPPKLALLLFSSFVIYILVRDLINRREAVSIATVIPLIWVLIMGSRMVSYWVSLDASKDVSMYSEGSPLDRTVFLVLIVWGVIILLRRPLDWSTIVAQNKAIFLLFGFFLLSVLWSDFPFVAFKRWIKNIGNIVMILILMTERSPQESIKSILTRTGYVLIPFSVLIIKYFPEYGRFYHIHTYEMMVSGVAGNKNALGVTVMVVLIYFIWMLIERIKNREFVKPKQDVAIELLIIVMAIWLLDLANSATAQMSFFIGLFVLLTVELPLIKKTIANLRWNFLGLLSISLPFVWLSFNSLVNTVLDAAGRDDTFWGRVELWKDLIDMGSASPVVGAGFASFWLGPRMAELWSKYWWGPTQAHNGYVEIYLDLGVVGLVLYASAILLSFKYIEKLLNAQFAFGKLRLAFFVLPFFYNITEAAVNGLHLVWFMWLLTMFETHNYYSRHDRSNARIFDRIKQLRHAGVASS